MCHVSCPIHYDVCCVDGASLSALHAVDLRGSDVIERILLCPRGKIFFHFFVDGHPVLLSHVPSEHCGRRTYNNGAHHVSVANTAYVAPPSSRTATPGAILSIGGSSANVLGIINHCSVGTVLEKWLEDLLLAAQTRPKAPEQKTEVVVQEEPQKPSRYGAAVKNVCCNTCIHDLGVRTDASQRILIAAW